MKHPPLPKPRRRSRCVPLTITAILLAGSSFAQTQVKDFTPGVVGHSGNPGPVVQAGGLAFFAAQTQFGIELWRSDGSAVGTFQVKDLNPGADSSNPEEITAVGNQVFFRAEVPGYGRELFVSDGTAAGTHLVRDIRPAAGLGSEPQHLCAFQGRVYCSADDGVHGPELWVSDGTAAATQMVVDLFAGSNPGAPDNLVAWNGRLWFVAQDGRGRELYSSDGTALGTAILVDLVPGVGSAQPANLTAASGILYFSATETGFGTEIYATDGTAAGTRRVLDIHPGSIGSFPRQLTALGSLVVFEAGDQGHGTEPWRSDGTAAGTFLLGDLNPGGATSMIQELTLAPAGNRIFFAAGGGGPRTLWSTDGSVAGTFVVQPALQSVSNLGAAFGGVVCAGQTATTGATLWISDGTAGGTAPVVGSPPPQYPRGFGSGALFTAYHGSVGRELFFSDGTTAGTGLVLDIGVDFISSPLANMTELRGGLLFSPTLSIGWVPWFSDGTLAGTSELNLGLGNPQQPVRWNGEVWFVASTPTTGYELCSSNGSPLGTTLAIDVVPGTGSASLGGLTPTSGRLFFLATTANGRELWATDGTPAGTRELDLNPGAAGASPQDMVAFGNRCVFSADDGSNGREPWISDGTVAGTVPLGDLLPGFAASSPAGFAVVGTRVFFVASLPNVGRELCVSNGTAAGTSLFVDLLAGTGSSSPHDLVGCGSLLFFKAASAPGSGIKLCVSDGTAAGTGIVRDISPSIANVQIEDMVGVDGRLFCFADDQVHGRELWTSDGTAAGTVLVADLMPGSGDGPVAGTLTRIPGTQRVLFAAGDDRDGLQLWQSDGTAAGTVRIGSMGPRPGTGATMLALLTPAGGRLFFHGGVGDGQGDELWVAPLQPAGNASSWSYGDAQCPGLLGLAPHVRASGLPQPGNQAFAIELADARSQSLALLQLAFAPQDILIGHCHLLLQPPLTTASVATTDALGTSRSPLPIPANPALIGLRLFGQYVVLDGNGSLFGSFAFSDGIVLQLGS